MSLSSVCTYVCAAGWASSCAAVSGLVFSLTCCVINLPRNFYVMILSLGHNDICVTKSLVETGCLFYCYKALREPIGTERSAVELGLSQWSHTPLPLRGGAPPGRFGRSLLEAFSCWTSFFFLIFFFFFKVLFIFETERDRA